MSSPPLITYRALGQSTGVINITASPAGGGGLIEVVLQLATALQPLTNVKVDTGANQETVEVLAYNPLLPSFTANFVNNHTSGVPIIIPNPGPDPQWGLGQANFLSNLEAVQQAINTRLQLFLGEWWASLTDGLPLWQGIAAQSGAAVNQMAAIITARIQGTPYVTAGGVSNVQAVFNPVTRAFTYGATVNTQFGSIPVSVSPTPPSGAFPNG
jgi:hypothetical protein